MDKIVFKCRCSAIGKIMTEAKEKSNLEKYNDAIENLSNLEKRIEGLVNKSTKTYIDLSENKIPKAKNLISELELIKHKKSLSETCKTYLKEWILNYKYGRKKEFSNKFTDKGNSTEQDGFQVIQDVLFNSTFLPKNKIKYEDEYFIGTPDVDVVNFIIDNKSSWNLFTFPIGEFEIPDKIYDWQGRGYMRLANKENFLLCYTLNDTPTELIEDEIFRFKRNNNLIDISDQETYKVAKNFLFTFEGLQKNAFLYSNADTSDFIEIPIEKRLVKFQTERDLELEQKIINRVIECNEWINQNYDKF